MDGRRWYASSFYATLRALPALPASPLPPFLDAVLQRGDGRARRARFGMAGLADVMLCRVRDTVTFRFANSRWWRHSR